MGLFSNFRKRMSIVQIGSILNSKEKDFIREVLKIAQDFTNKALEKDNFDRADKVDILNMQAAQYDLLGKFERGYVSKNEIEMLIYLVDQYCEGFFNGGEQPHGPKFIEGSAMLYKLSSMM